VRGARGLPSVQLTIVDINTSDALPPDDEGMETLRALKGLEKLSAGHISDIGFQVLRDLPSLKKLRLAGSCTITDDGCIALSGLTNLEKPYIFCPGVTDAALAHLNVLGVGKRSGRAASPFPKPRKQRDVAGGHYLTKAEINALCFAAHRLKRPRGWIAPISVGRFWRWALVVFFKLEVGVCTFDHSRF